MPSCRSQLRTLLHSWSAQPPATHAHWQLRRRHLARSYSAAPESAPRHGKHSSKRAGLSSLDAESSYLDLILGPRDRSAEGVRQQALYTDHDGPEHDEDGDSDDVTVHAHTGRRRRRGGISASVTPAANGARRIPLRRTPVASTAKPPYPEDSMIDHLPDAEQTSESRPGFLQKKHSSRAAEAERELKRRLKSGRLPHHETALAFRSGLRMKSVFGQQPAVKRLIVKRRRAFQDSRPHNGWYDDIARLVKPFKHLKPEDEPELQRPPTVTPEAIEEVDKFLDELDRVGDVSVGCLRGSIRPHLWSYALLWFLFYNPEQASDFIRATYSTVYRRNICIHESLRYLALRFSHYKDELAIRELADTALSLSEAWSKTQFLHGFWHGRFYVPLLPVCDAETLTRFEKDMKDHQSRVHYDTWLHFVGAFAKRDRFDQALDVILEAKSAGVALDSYKFRSCCATLLRRSVRHRGGLRSCIRIVDNLVKLGLPLNNHLVNIIILNAVEAGDLKTAFAIYHSLVDHGLKADAYTYTALLKGCKANIDDSEMLNSVIRDALAHINVHKEPVLSTEILHCLALHHTKHNLASAFETVADAFAQLFDLKALRQIDLVPAKYSQVNEVETERPPPSPVDMNTIISTYLEKFFQGKNADVKAAHELYQRVKTAADAGTEPFATMLQTDHNFNAFLCTFIRSKKGLLSAAELVKDMQGKNRPKGATPKYCEPTVYTWSIFLDGFTRHGQMRLAEQVLAYMRTKGIEPNRVTYNTLVRGYATKQQTEAMLDVLRRMETDGQTWDEWTVKGTRHLRDQAPLHEALQREKQAQALDFTADLRGGLQKKLAAAEMAEVRPRGQAGGDRR